MNLYALAAGIIIGAFVAVKFHKSNDETRRRVYPLLLATFPIYYLVFAVYGSDYEALKYEMISGILFISVAYWAFKLGRSALLVLALAYIGHAIYDAVHNTLFLNAGAPLWWPEFCGSVDGLIGVYLLIMAFAVKPAARKPA